MLGFKRGRGIDCLLKHSFKDSQTGKEQYEGCCNQRSAPLVAMCRSMAIPARCVTGSVGWFPWVPANSAERFETNLFDGQFAGAEHFTQSPPHMWTEFYIPNYGWIPDDSLPEAWNGRLIFSKGRDILIGPNFHTEEKNMSTRPSLNGTH